MTRPYSLDLRARVVEAVDEGATRAEAAERFGVSVASAVRWHKAWQSDGSIEAKPYGGSRSPLEDYAEELLTLMDEQNDWTLNEIVDAMHKRQIPGSRTSLLRFLVRHDITFKRMARPVRKWFLHGSLTNLRQRIRPRDYTPGQDGDPRVLVLIKSPAPMRHFLNQVSRTPVDCRAISFSTTRKQRRPITA